VANLQSRKHKPLEFALLFFWKILYVMFIFIIPILAGYDASSILWAFLIMHFCLSLFFIHVLIATHLCMETQFPQTNTTGNLPGDYYAHQLSTSLDYAPTSKAFNWFFGGFNAHAAHHLYPKLPHTTYPEISVLIEKKAREFNVRYNKLSLVEAICSRYRFLKMMGRQPGCTQCPDCTKKCLNYTV
jgi:linoleoyl-CoA desaturase